MNLDKPVVTGPFGRGAVAKITLKKSLNDKKVSQRSLDELLANNYEVENFRGDDGRTSKGEEGYEECLERSSSGDCRGRFSEERKSSRGREGLRCGKGNFPRKKLANGRNGFPTGDEDLDFAKGCGKSKLAFVRNVFIGPSRGGGGNGRARGRFSGKKVAIGKNVFEPEDRPGLGVKAVNEENSSWNRWQELYRKKPGQEGSNGSPGLVPSRDTSLVSDGNELLESPIEAEASRSEQGTPNRSCSPQSIKHLLAQLKPVPRSLIPHHMLEKPCNVAFDPHPMEEPTKKVLNGRKKSCQTQPSKKTAKTNSKDAIIVNQKNKSLRVQQAENALKYKEKIVEIEDSSGIKTYQCRICQVRLN